MVKREKSPEAIEDERYFTVWQPYPLNANWELENDCIEFCRWIACCIGIDPVHGIHYKPKARGMVLLEIDKNFAQTGRLLGEHRWTQFLRKPAPEEEGRVSQIFHSLYSTGREAQKDGWKRIHVEVAWFKDWTNTTIRNPYPDTYWCPVPPEDMTNKPLCRHLPKSVKPPPPQVPPPVVGSAGWVEKKAAPKGAQKNAWTKGKPAIQSTAKSAPVSRVSSVNAWDKPIYTPENNPKERNNTSGTSKTVHIGPNGPAPPISPIAPVNLVSRSNSATGPPAYPPGLPIRGSAFPAPGLVRKANSGGALSSSSGAGPVPVEALEDLFEDQVTISLSPSQERDLYDLEDDGFTDSHSMVVHPWEQVAVAEETWGDVAETEGNLWGEPAPKKPAANVILCPVHGIICKKGICKEMAKILKEQEKAKIALEREAQGKKPRKGGNWRQNRSRSGSGEDESGVDKDGFSKAGGRNKGGRKGGPGRGRQNRNDKKSAVGSESITHGKEASPSGEIGGAAESTAGDWDTASVGPWG